MFPLILATATILLFANTFGGDFVYDDLTVVVKNPEIRYWHFWDLWDIMGRSTRTLSLMIDYHLFGDSPTGYHFQNILWHVLSVLLLYLTFIKLSGDRLLSFTGALLFAVHPIHVEAVANVANRKEMLCMTFSLLSFLSYLKFIEGKGGKKWQWLLGSFFCWYLAINSKQVAIVLPLSMVVYEYIFLPEGKRFLTAKPLLLAGALLSGGFLVYQYTIKDIVFEKAGYIGEFSPFSLMLNTPRAILSYFQLLLFPLNLSPDYFVKSYSSLADPVVVLSWIVVLAVLVLPFYLIRRMPLLSFGIFWFFIHYIPVSSLIPHTHMLADRYMYIPSVAYCLLMLGIAQKLRHDLTDHPNKRYVFILSITFAATVLALYSVKTIRYNSIWKNDKGLWEYAARVSPNSVTAHYKVGNIHSESGNYRQALKAYGEAIELYPFYPQSADLYTNRGNAYGNLAYYDKAINDYNKAIEVNPRQADAYYNRGVINDSLGNRKQAMSDWRKAIDLNPMDKDASNNLGRLEAEERLKQQGDDVLEPN